MSSLWLDHIAKVLEKHNIVAYVWHMDDDRFEWRGDLQSLFGNDFDDLPENREQFNKTLNPQDVPQRLAALHEFMSKPADAEAAFESSYKMRHSDGSYLEVEETASLSEGEDGRKLCGVIKINSKADASKPAGNIEAISLGYTHNGRRALMHKIEEWFDTKRADAKTFGYFLSVGIDRMAVFNDVMGPEFADELIEKTGKRLQKIMADAGTVIRTDGDVYGILFDNGPHNEMAAVAKYILNNFNNLPLETTRGPVGISISIGGVPLHQANNAASAITMAEMAMNVAKDKGRSCFVSYDEASVKAEGNKALLHSADTFLKAMKENRLRLAFQPVMNSKGMSVSFHESLIRLIDTNGKLIPAGSFMPAVEELGLARLVDHYALRMAIEELTMFPDLSLSVNVSNLTLNNNEWLRSIVAALRDRPSVAERLVVEITESAIIQDMEFTQRIIRTLQDLGCRVALDDFGAGYTAFSQLKDLHVDIVKIDKSFVRNMKEAHNHLFIKTLKDLAQGIDVKTVGEGAETLAEARLLADDGIDYIQGYAYGFPKVERVWLPKDHRHRNILDSMQNKISRDDLHEDIMEDITALHKSDVA